MALTELVHDDLEHFGTSGYVRLSDEELGIALRALRAVLKRLDIAVEVPLSVPLVLPPNPVAVLAALRLVVPSLPAAGLVVAGTRRPPSRRSGPAQSKGSGLPSGYRPDCRSITRQGNLAKQSQ